MDNSPERLTLRNCIELLATDTALRSNLSETQARGLVVSAIDFLCALDALGCDISTAYDGLRSEIDKANASHQA